MQKEVRKKCAAAVGACQVCRCAKRVVGWGQVCVVVRGRQRCACACAKRARARNGKESVYAAAGGKKEKARNPWMHMVCAKSGVRKKEKVRKRGRYKGKKLYTHGIRQRARACVAGGWWQKMKDVNHLFSNQTTRCHHLSQTINTYPDPNQKVHVMQKA